jgi:hypothetical protein
VADGTAAYFDDLRRDEVTLRSILQSALATMEANEGEELPGNATPDDFECILAGLLICGGRKLPLAMHDIGLCAWEKCCY